MDVAARETDDNRRRRRPLVLHCFYFVEIPLAAAVGTLAYLLHYTDVFQSNNVIYEPSDITLSRPFTPEQNKMISSVVVLLATTAVPCGMITIVECVLVSSVVCCKWKVKRPNESTECYIGRCLKRTIRSVGMYLFGFLATSALSDLFRKQIAALSPDFLSVCKPDPQRTEVSLQDAARPGTSPNSLKIVDMYFSDDCSAVLNLERLDGAKSSLPSYFVSLTTYTAVFCMLYLRAVLARAGTVVRSLIVCSTLLFPYVLGLVEMAENTSHVTAVIAGWVLGAASACLLGYEIFSTGFMPKCKFPRICGKRRQKNKDSAINNNVFENDFSQSAFSRRGYHVAEEDVIIEITHPDEEPDIARPKSRVEEQNLGLASASPALSRKSQPTSEKADDHRKGHSAERQMIKELKTYITDTNVRGGVDSPKPTQIRELSRDTARPNRKQVFSTFQATPEIEIQDEKGWTENLPGNHQAPAKTTDLTTFEYIMGFHKAPPFEGRPFSYHGGSLSPSSDGSFEDGALHPPGTVERPMSFSHRPRDRDDSSSKDAQEPAEPEGILSCFAHNGQPTLHLIGNSSGASSPRNSSRVTDSTNGSTHDGDEASNLLRAEIASVENTRDGAKGSTSDSESSNETITEDQPSILV